MKKLTLAIVQKNQTKFVRSSKTENLRKKYIYKAPLRLVYLVCYLHSAAFHAIMQTIIILYIVLLEASYCKTNVE